MTISEEISNAFANAKLTTIWDMVFANNLLDIFLQHKQAKGMFYFIGNGGSAAIASHMTADFLKNGGCKTHSMLEPSTITCLANDFGYEYVFSKQLEMFAREGDLLVAISSSGESPNILRAVEVAKKSGCESVTFSGFKPDNTLRGSGDHNFYVPSMKYGIVESVHNLVLQQIVDDIAARDGVGMTI